MSYQLTQKLRDLVPYEPVSGHYPIRLDANESFISLPSDLRDKAAAAAARVDFNRYPDPCAREVCRAFGEYYGVDPRYITAGNGSDELLSILANSFFSKGDTVAVLSPDFSMYGFYLEQAELNVAVFRKGEDFSVDVEKLSAFLRDTGAKGILFSNPGNPTGRGLSREDIRERVRNFDGLVALDEAYMDFWDSSLLREVNEFDNLLILRTCSKAIGLAGIRLGFAVAGDLITRAFRAAKSPYNVNAMTQAFAAVVLRERDYLDDCVRRLVRSRRELYEALVRLQGRTEGIVAVYPPVTNFVFLKACGSRGLFEGLLAKGIAVRHMGEHLRISAGSPVENKAVLEALEELLCERKGA